MSISHDISAAVGILKSGGLVAMPTETVYGLAADAENELAVRGIFAAKGRPADHPLIVHLAATDQISQWAFDIPDATYDLAKAFWPGPLTIILKRSEKAALAVTGGLHSIGLRVPGIRSHWNYSKHSEVVWPHPRPIALGELVLRQRNMCKTN